MNGSKDNGVAVAVAAHPVEEDRQTATRMLLIWTGVAVILAVALVAFLGREDTGSKTVPPQLIGTWTSAHPDYSDRYLVLTSDSITFGIGGTSTVIYSIIGAAVEEHHGNQHFVVHFRGIDGTRFRREIVLDEGGMSLHFKSQPGVVWTHLTI